MYLVTNMDESTTMVVQLVEPMKKCGVIVSSLEMKFFDIIVGGGNKTFERQII